MEKRTKAVFVPSSKMENFDLRASNRNQSEEDSGQVTQLLKKEDVQNFFSGYYYNIDEDKEKMTKPTNNTALPSAKDESLK